MSNQHWVIAQHMDAYKWDYWSNEYGWGSVNEATRYTHEERNAIFLLPLGGEWRLVENCEPEHGFTPGPWEPLPPTGHAITNIAIRSLNDRRYREKVAVVESMDAATAEINADLICAAPEMYFVIDQLAERECEYGDGANCLQLPQGVYRSVCLPCQARRIVSERFGNW